MEIAVSTSPAHIMMTRKRNTWYSIRDGNWNDPNTWMSNALDKRNNICPQAGDDVYVNHTVNFDNSVVTQSTVRNIYISGKLTAGNASGIQLNINGDLQCTGSIDFTGSGVTIALNGYNNFINSLIAGNSTIQYSGILNQFILNLSYKNLSTFNGQKYQTSDLTITGNFNPQCNYEVGAYNLTVNGNSTIGTVGLGLFTKNSAIGSILFIGNVDFEGSTDLSGGNSNVEFRGGMIIHTFSFISGFGTFTFTTNNQTLACTAYLGGSFNANIVIQGSIILTLTGGYIFRTNGTINGTVSGSTLNNDSILYLDNSTTPMTTGIFNYQHSSTSTIGYMFNGNFTLPYTTYANLVIGGTGIKMPSGNTIITQSFQNNGGFECSGFNLSITGDFTNTGGGPFTTSTFSTITIGGLLNVNSDSGAFNFDLRTGNANVEIKGGWTVHANVCYTGTGTFKFSTNNQTINFSAYNGGILGATLLISGAITVTYTNGAALMDCLGILKGDNALSTFDNRGVFTYGNAVAPMSTGKLYCNQAANTFIYDLAGNQDITVPSDPTPGYKNLTLNGSGAKRLLGNTSVKGTYILTPPATLNTNGYALTNP